MKESIHHTLIVKFYFREKLKQSLKIFGIHSFSHGLDSADDMKLKLKKD